MGFSKVQCPQKFKSSECSNHLYDFKIKTIASEEVIKPQLLFHEFSSFEFFISFLTTTFSYIISGVSITTCLKYSTPTPSFTGGSEVWRYTYKPTSDERPAGDYSMTAVAADDCSMWWRHKVGACRGNLLITWTTACSPLHSHPSILRLPLTQPAVNNATVA